jgi:hypothetical protein
MNNGKWKLKGDLTSFVQFLPNGACDGVGTLYYWDSAANSGTGDWVVSEAGVTFTISFTDQGTALKKGAKTITPDQFRIHINHIVVSGEPSPLPNTTLIDLKGGDISIKK